MKHKGKPAYPGPADIELYGLKIREGNVRSKVADMAAANLAGNGLLQDKRSEV